MSLTFEQRDAQRRGSFISNFDRLERELRRVDRGQSCRDPVARRSLEMLLPHQLDAVRKYAAQVEQWRRQVVRDILTRGQVAREWYLNTSDFSREVVQALAAPAPGRPVAATPRERRERRSANGTRGSPDDDDGPEPPPQPHQLALVPRREWAEWVRARFEEVEAFQRGEEGADRGSSEPDQLSFEERAA
jgi:hypothetical protein